MKRLININGKEVVIPQSLEYITPLLTKLAAIRTKQKELDTRLYGYLGSTLLILKSKDKINELSDVANFLMYDMGSVHHKHFFDAIRELTPDNGEDDEELNQ